VGYYGEHNLGDDALLEVLLAQLASGGRAARHGPRPAAGGRALRGGLRRPRSLRGCWGPWDRPLPWCFGGGSLLQDSTSFLSLLYYASLIVAARLQSKPVLLWAQGLGPCAAAAVAAGAGSCWPDQCLQLA
jgi:hypothetical protein